MITNCMDLMLQHQTTKMLLTNPNELQAPFITSHSSARIMKTTG